MPASRKTAEASDFLPRPADLRTAAGTLSLLSHPARLEVLCHLSREGELSAGEIVARVRLSQSALSQHLAKLRTAGLLERRRSGQSIIYRIARRDIDRILGLLHELYCAKNS